MRGKNFFHKVGFICTRVIKRNPEFGFFHELVLSILQVVLHSGRVSHQSGSRQKYFRVPSINDFHMLKQVSLKAPTQKLS